MKKQQCKTGIVSSWSGKFTFRVNIGKLWLCVNLKMPAIFLQSSGNFQLQTWNGPYFTWYNVDIIPALKATIAYLILIGAILLILAASR